MKTARVLNVQPLADDKKSAFLQFYDTIQPVSSQNNYLVIKKDVTERIQSGKATKSDYEKNIYFLALEGQYKESQQERNQYCTRFKVDCKKESILYTLQGKVLSGSGVPISGVTIRVAGGIASVKTDIQGKYTLTFPTFPQTKVRVEAYKPGFSNAFYPIDILSPVTQQSGFKDFTLETPVQFAFIDTVQNTISGEGTAIDKGYFTIKTSWSHYKIPF